MTAKGDALQRLYEWAGALAEELEELQDAIFDIAEGEDDDGGPVPERCGGGRRYYPAMTLDEGEPLSSSVMTGGDGPPVTYERGSCYAKF